MYLYFFVYHENMSFFLHEGRFRLQITITWIMSAQLVSGSVNLIL